MTLLNEQDSSAAVLDYLQSVLRVSDQKLADQIGLSRMQVWKRRHDQVAISVKESRNIGKALEVPPSLLLGTVEEAMRWVTQHRPDLPDPRSRCTALAA